MWTCKTAPSSAGGQASSLPSIGPHVCTILLSEGRLCALEQYVRHSTKKDPELRRLRTYELRRTPQRVEKRLNAPPPGSVRRHNAPLLQFESCFESVCVPFWSMDRSHKDFFNRLTPPYSITYADWPAKHRLDKRIGGESTTKMLSEQDRRASNSRPLSDSTPSDAIGPLPPTRVNGR